MIVDVELGALNPEALGELERIGGMFTEAKEKGWPLHKFEEELWKILLRIGHSCTQSFVDSQGTGDFGPTLEVEGRKLRRLEKPHDRRYVSIFGPLRITRTIYGTRETQKHELVPLDARLGLPEGEFSLLLEGWAQEFCVNLSFAKSRDLLKRVLGVSLSVRTLEHMNRANAKDAEEYQEVRPAPRRIRGNEIHTLTADGKGVAMRRGEGEEPVKGRRKKGEKANKKREACVGASYLIDPFERTPEEVLGDLEGEGEGKERPRPQDKRIHGELSQEGRTGKEATFEWLKEMKEQRDPEGKFPVVCVMDGSKGLWKQVKEKFPGVVKILDIFHVSERVWEAAHIFYPEGSKEAADFAREKLLGILRGRAGRVVGGIRQMATKRGIKGSKRKRLEVALKYLEKNKEYMKYDEYLAKGYPIGSGVVEGACRNLVKDRFELTGMSWTREGAQAMLRMRAISINGDWKEFQGFRREKVLRNLHPHRDRFVENWPLAA